MRDLNIWLTFGLDEQTFWRLSPCSINRIVVAQNQILIRGHNERAWLAWHTAALTRMQRMPELDQLLHKEPRREQTWQEQLAIVQQWAAVTKRKQDNA